MTNHLESSPKGGRELLCKLNHDVLLALLGEELAVFHLKLPEGKPPGIRPLVRAALRGHIDGVDDDSISEIARFAAAEPRLAKVFIDGSNLGALAAALKRRLPAVEVITFFHNVEARFFLGSLRTRRSLRAAGVLLANWVAEREAVRASDKRICLSERDSRLLKKVYGRGATDISPMALEDKLPATHVAAASQPPQGEPYALFVGSTFYANRLGIEWYVDHVAPIANVKIRIVGRGLEALRNRLQASPNVTVVGEVDHLASWYREARFVIAPIFDGSGMKTKVAEAMMYGKKVVGTPEAFSGYEPVARQAGWLCGSAAEFARAMELAVQTPLPQLDAKIRQLYVDNYSEAAARGRMAGILGARRTE